MLPTIWLSFEHFVYIHMLTNLCVTNIQLLVLLICNTPLIS